MNTLVEIIPSQSTALNTVKVSVIKSSGPGCRWINIRCHSADTCMAVDKIIKDKFGINDESQRMSAIFRTKEEVDPTYIESQLPYHYVDIKGYERHEWLLEQAKMTNEAFQVALSREAEENK